MTFLNEIRDYVQKTAEIIASVLEMQVIICDSNRELIGDSYPIWSPSSKLLNDTSILTKVMESGEKITLEDISEYEGCRICKNNSVCEIKAILGVPILHKGLIIGSIGILADTYIAKEKLLKKNSNYHDFIDKMSDLLLSKLIEKEKNNELIIMRERLISIVNSTDGALIAIDENGEIIHYNSTVNQFVDEKIELSSKVDKLIPNAAVNSLIKAGESFKNREVVFAKGGRLVYSLISGKPIIMDDQNFGFTLLIKKLTDVYSEVNNLSNDNDIITGFERMIGESNEIKAVKDKASMVSKSSSTVLIQGESGTGKEILARAIHSSSKSYDKPFIAINCAAIPDDLLESELFGYEDGAFTGAKKGGKIGKFQLAEGGTIFLDEIGEMPLHLQSKILRVLQERKIEKLGGSSSIDINVRIIAATNKNLETQIMNNEFREDLYYRLSVIPVYIPPLRDRKSDIPLLLNYFLDSYNTLLQKSIRGYSQNSMDVLLSYDWKGNVRELQNLVEYSVNMAKGDYITVGDLPSRVIESASTYCKSDDSIVKPIEELISLSIDNALKIYGTDLNGKTQAAKALGISLATLYRKTKA